MVATINPLIFPIPNSLRLEYEANPLNNGLFDGDNLVLFVKPEDYQITKTYGLNSPIIGFNSTFVKLENIPYEISATITDSRSDIAKILIELINTAQSNPYSYQLVTMYDYHTLETAQGVADGFETRQGLLSFELSGGSYRVDHSDPTSYRYFKGLKLLFRGVYV